MSYDAVNASFCRFVDRIFADAGYNLVTGDVFVYVALRARAPAVRVHRADGQNTQSRLSVIANTNTNG
jgi:hypothetical protein